MARLVERDARWMYEELVSRYRRYYLQPRKVLDREIAKRVSAGMSWEEAVESLYREILEARREAPREEVEGGLETALESLKRAEGELRGIYLALALILMLLLLAAAFSGNPGSALAVWLLGVLLLVSLSVAQSAARREWVYRENLIVRGAGGRWREVAELVPKVFQKLTLQNVEWGLEGNKLTMKIRLEKSVVERGQGGSHTVTADLGPFVVEAVFEDMGGDLAVNALYRGEPPVARGSLAAEVYERVIVAFRSSLDEAWS